MGFFLVWPLFYLTSLNSIWHSVGIQYIFVEQINRYSLSSRPTPGGQLMPLDEGHAPQDSLDTLRRKGSQRTAQKHLRFSRDHSQVTGRPLTALPESHADLWPHANKHALTWFMWVSLPGHRATRAGTVSATTLYPMPMSTSTQ